MFFIQNWTMENNFFDNINFLVSNTTLSADELRDEDYLKQGGTLSYSWFNVNNFALWLIMPL